MHPPPDAPRERAPVMLLHSGGMSSRQWRLLSEALTPKWRVIVPDLLGSGAQPAWPHDARFEFQMEVDALLAALPAGEPAHLVGHSYGALMALKIAQQQPDRVRSLALYEPPAFGILQSPPDHEALAELSALERNPVFTDPVTGGNEAWMRAFIGYWSGPDAWDQLPEPARAAFLRVGRKVFFEVSAIMTDRTSSEAYAALKTPALLMSGALSPLAERRVMQRLADAMTHGALRVFEGAGHMGPITHAHHVNEAIGRHLEAAHAASQHTSQESP